MAGKIETSKRGINRADRIKYLKSLRTHHNKTVEKVNFW
jgi:hypothetical protein